jgi:biotin carboxyl carrier protein
MKRLRITLEGRSYDVTVEFLEEASSLHTPQPPVASSHAAVLPAAVVPTAPAPDSGSGRSVTSPMAGLVFKCLVKPGDVVTLNQVVIVLDAMKMETPVHAPVAGTVLSVLVKEGDAVDEGHNLLQIEGGAQ